jgi:hypothetical protein
VRGVVFSPSTSVGVVVFGPWIWKYPFRLEALELANAAPTAEGAFYSTAIIQTRQRQTRNTRQQLSAGGVQRV